MTEIQNKTAKLALEDGSIFTGKSFAADGTTEAEVVFNTSMTGYQEILTDPSYRGQIVTMTYPLIGNYGISQEDIESRNIHVSGFIVKEPATSFSNFRSTNPLQQYLIENGVIGLCNVDTRSITRRLRIKGAMKGVLSTEIIDDIELVRRARASTGLIGLDMVKHVTRQNSELWKKGYDSAFAGPVKIARQPKQTAENPPLVVAFDCGIKDNICRNLVESGFEVVVLPAGASYEQIMEYKPDAVFVSNGPGDPEPIEYTVDTVRKLIKDELPMFGICLGIELIGLALGGKTFKLKFGHRGANQPVKNLDTDKVEITAQNHGFAVDIDSLNKNDIRITHINLNDNTLEGIAHKKIPLFAVQYHPEASPGPHDSTYLFDEFYKLVRTKQPPVFE